MKRTLLSSILCILLLLFSPSLMVYAFPEWPEHPTVESDAAIVMDAYTGTVIYGKNIHQTFYPASITKVMTAIIVLENSDLDEMVTFSKNAVYNVESGSTNAGYDTGDTALLEDCLYALLLKSANEVANALAEHVAGSTEAFVDLMNQKAKALGCSDSHFANPSGLNNEENYVSAYDMALITRYAFQNPTFSKIVSTTYYELASNSKYPDGLAISPGNKMIKKNTPEYRKDVLGGKTGFTSQALNTLVVGAKQKDMRLITVVLHSSVTHYQDTNKLLDFGFNNFKTVQIKDLATTYTSLGDDLMISDIPVSEIFHLSFPPDGRILLPNHADLEDITSTISYNLPPSAPQNAIAKVKFYFGEREVGSTWLNLDFLEKNNTSLPEELIKPQINDIISKSYATDADYGLETENESDKMSKKTDYEKDNYSSRTNYFQVIIAVFVLTFFTGVIFWIKKKRKIEKLERGKRHQKRMARLKEQGIPEEKFYQILQRKRRRK